MVFGIENKTSLNIPGDPLRPCSLTTIPTLAVFVSDGIWSGGSSASFVLGMKKSEDPNGGFHQ